MGSIAAITGIGHFVPEKVLSNQDLEKMVETNDEWIVSRTGIRERHILEDGKGTSFMASKAAQKALAHANMSAEDLELIIVSTVTPDMFFPSTGCLVQDAIGAKNAWAFDLNGACSGFIYGLTTAAQFIESGRYSRVMVIGADKMSSIADYTDRNTCILFGDAAAAVILEPSKDGNGVIDYILKSDGSGKDALNMKGGGSLNPATHETVDKKLHYIYQDGRTVYKFAVAGMAAVTEEIAIKHNLSGDDIDLFVPHQANSRIIEATARRMKLPMEKVLLNIGKYGNTTAATIPLGLSEALQEGRLKPGDNVILSAFGAGYTWGSVYLKWSI